MNISPSSSKSSLNKHHGDVNNTVLSGSRDDIAGGSQITSNIQADDSLDGLNDLMMNGKNLFLHFWVKFWTVLEGIGLAAGLCVQGAILDYFIIYYGKGAVGWFFLLLIDFLVAILFIIAIVMAKKHYSSWRRSRSNGINNSTAYAIDSVIAGDSVRSDVDSIEPGRLGQAFLSTRFPSTLGVLPLSYISWFIYSIVLVVKIFIFFINDIPLRMVSGEEVTANGPKLFEVSLALTALIFLLWIEAHKNMEDEVHQRWSKSLTNELIGHTTFEIFDLIFFLDLITPDIDPVTGMVIKLPHISHVMMYTIVALGALNVVYPSIGLFQLSKLHKHSQQEESYIREHPESHIYGTNVLIHFIRLVNVNIPYLMIRIHLAASYDRNLSIFIVKNILGIIVSLRSLIIEFFLWRGYVKANKKLRTTNKKRTPQIRIVEPPDSERKPRVGWKPCDKKKKSSTPNPKNNDEIPSLIIADDSTELNNRRRNTNESDQSEDGNLSINRQSTNI